MKFQRSFIPLFTGLAAFMLALGILFGNGAQAAPAAIPTPLANPAVSQDALNITFFAARTMTADTRSSSLQLPEAEVLDLQYVIDQGTVNTVTLRIDFSNDPLCVSTPASAVWSPGVNVVASNAADANNMVQLNNFGRCTSILADVTNTNTLTVTVRAVAK